MNQFIQRSNSIGSSEDLGRQSKRKKGDLDSEDSASKQLQVMEKILLEISAIRQDNSEIKKELRILQDKYETNEKKWHEEKKMLETRIKMLEEYKEKEEKRRKKCNVVISGIKTDEENVETEVHKLFADQFNIQPAIEKPILIGNQKNQKILVRFLNYSDKVEVMKKKSLIKEYIIKKEN